MVALNSDERVSLLDLIGEPEIVLTEALFDSTRCRNTEL
jgi:hypothetical protein